jgi:RHS repeat-associated protein
MFKRLLLFVATAAALTLAASAESLKPGWHEITSAPHRSAADMLAELSAAQPSALAAEPMVMGALMESSLGVVESGRLTELAAALENDPVKIFEFVRNTIDYVPYYGELKGAGRTLLDQAGNDADQADLLIKLLEAAGYEAGFVFGTMTMPDWSASGMDLSHWLGVDWWDVPTCLDNGGIPFDYGAGYTYDLIRIWVRVWVDGTPYDLDPAFKRYNESVSKNIASLAGYDRSTFLSAAGGSNTTDYAQGLNNGAISNALCSLTSALRAGLKTTYPNATLQEITGGRTVIQEEIDSLNGQIYFPTAMPIYSEELSTALYHPVSVVYDEMNYEGYLHEIAESGLTLRFSETSSEVQSMAAPLVSEPESPLAMAASLEEPAVLEERSVTPEAAGDAIVALATGSPVNMGSVYNRSPYNLMEQIIYQTYNTYGESVSFTSNPQGAFSNISFSDTDGGTHRYNVKIRFNGSGQSAGTKTAQVDYLFYYYGTHHQYFDLSGTVENVPSASLGTFYPDESYTATIWNKVSGATGQSVTLDNNTGGFSVVSDSNYVKVNFNAAGLGSGTRSCTVVYRFTYSGWNYVWVYDLTARVVQRPSLVDGSSSWSSPPKYTSETTTGTVRLKNTGTLTVTFSSASLTGSDASAFELVSGQGSGTIAPGAYRDITVRYRATTVGVHDDAYVGINFTYDGVAYNWSTFFPLWGQTVEDFYAQLWKGDTLIAQQLAPLSQTNLTISISHPYSTNTATTVDYPIKAGGTYAIITGFGSSNNGKLLADRQKAVRQMREQGLDSLSPEILSESLHVIGQAWLQETALHKNLLNNLLGMRQVYHHRVGVAAQEEGYYVDIKAQYSSSVAVGGYSQNAALKTASLFASAMEHGCLEQLQSSDREAVSTVKILKIANDNNWKIYRTSSNNWSTVSSVLEAGGYSADERTEFEESVNQRDGLLVLPQTRDVPLGDWAGKGYVQCENDNGLQSVAMIIGGDYHGGYGAYQWDLDTFYQDSLSTVNYYDYAETWHPTAADPVDMATGAYTFQHSDFSMDGPLPLQLSRSYNSSQNAVNGPMGYGWTHSFNIHAQRHSAYEQSLGIRSPEEAAAAMVSSMVVQDLIENADTPQGWTAAALTAQWAMDELTENAVSIYVGQKVLTFIEQPDGSFTPPPGVTTSLSLTNDVYVLQERHGNTYTFNANLKLEEMADPDGNTLTFSYNAQTNLQTLASSFGPALTFGYTGDLLTSVTDNSSPARSISYQYDPDSNLTNFVDAAGTSWGIGYDEQHRVKWMKDPEEITTIQNFYNSIGQVTNQISASGHPWDFYFNGLRNVSEDPLGNQTAYYVDEKSRTWSVEQPNGARSYTVYDGQNHVVESASPNGVTNVFTYDADHNLLAQTNAVGTAEEVASRYSYDSEHHLRFATNAVGTSAQTVTEMTYTGTHHVDTVTHAKGTSEQTVTDTDYYPSGLPQQVSEGNGTRVTTITYDSYGNPDVVTSTDAGSVDYLYDIQGNLRQQTLDGKTAEFSYDARRLMTNAIYGKSSADEVSTSRTYWENGLLKTSTDARNKTVTTYWNAAYKQAGTVFPDTGSITNLYDEVDRLVASRDAEGNWSTNLLDSVGNPVTVASATSSVTNEFDIVGNLKTSMVDPGGLNLWTMNDYDSLNRLESTQNAIGSRQFQYDPMGRTTNSVDAAEKEWKKEYDALGRVRKTFRPSGNFEEYAFNALGSRTHFWNAERNPMTFGVDAQGRITSITNAISKVTDFGFDDAGNMAWRLNAENELTTYGYDSLNRLVAVTNQGSEVAVFDHDANGNVIWAANSNATVVLGYDEMNRLTSTTQSVAGASFAVQSAYNLNGSRTNIVYPGGLTVSYDYGADNRLEGITTKYLGSTKTVSLGYDGANRLTGIAYPNGVNSTFGYNAENRVTNMVHGTFVDRKIIRNVIGFKETELINAGIQPTVPDMRRSLKTHNDADQLVSEQVQQGTNQYTVGYGYNDNGALDQVITDSLLTKSFGYDYNNLLTSVDSTSSSVEYLYDASGSRVGRVDGGVTNWFVIDYADGLKRPFAEADASGNITRYYVWSGAHLLCHIEVDGTVRYYHADELGSTLAITDASGNVTDQFAYMPYGYATHTGTTQTPYQWLGGYGVYYDADTDLHLTLHRAYSSSLKRFISPDPMGIDGGVNVYAMANLNPLFFVDPYGLSGLESVGSYLSDSWEQVWKGNYTDNVTALGTAGQIGTGLLGIDLPGDIRDLTYDVQNWEWSWSHAGQTTLDAVGLLPVIGALKYADEGASLVKGSTKAFDVGAYNDLKKLSETGDALDIHHVGQKHVMSQLVDGYDPKTAPSIAIPASQHQLIPTVKGSYSGSARDLLANDIQNLRNYTDAPNSSLQELIQMNKQQYPSVFNR